MKKKHKKKSAPRVSALRKTIAANLCLPLAENGRLIATFWVSPRELSEQEQEDLQSHLRKVYGATGVRSDML